MLFPGLNIEISVPPGNNSLINRQDRTYKTSGKSAYLEIILSPQGGRKNACELRLKTVFLVLPGPLSQIKSIQISWSEDTQGPWTVILR